MEAAKKSRYNRIWMLVCTMLCVIWLCACGQQQEQSAISQGMNALEELDYEGALGFFEQALVAGEDVRLICRGQGIAYLGLTQYEQAAEAFEQCLKQGSCIPGDMDFDVNYYLAAAYYKSGRLDDAKQVYDAILDLRSKEKDAYYLRGSILLEQDIFNKAKGDFDQAIALDPQNYNQLCAICEVLEAYGYEDVSREYLNSALDQYAKEMSNYDKGRIYFHLQDFESARNYLEQARDAGNAEAAYYLGRTWEALGEYNYAASVYNSYLKEQEQSALIYNQLALCQMALEDYEGALSTVKAGLELEDESLKQTLLFNQVVIYENMGQFKEAASLMSKYLRLYPDDETAKREYEFLRSR